MAICPRCGQLAEDTRELCPHCYAPIRADPPLHRRPAAIAALVLALAAAALLVRVLVQRFAR
jgi:predicted amidophosphoribosyltransferase